MSDICTDIQLADCLADQESAQSAWAYLNHVTINSDPAPRPFRDLAEPWQWDRCKYILPPIMSVTGHTDYYGPRNVWETMPRGHDKTSFIGRMMNWVLAYSKRQLRCIVAAKDSEQAGILKDCMETEAKLNPWLQKHLSFKQMTVNNPVTGSRLLIASSDARGLFGHGVDLFVIEEITHWDDNEGKKVFTALWSGRRKRPSAVLLVLCNAGLKKSWQHKTLELAKANSDWFVFEAPGQLTRWMDQAAIVKDRKMLPPSEARRLLDNQWVDPGELGGYISEEECRRIEETAKERHLAETTNLDPRREYIISVDYGPKKDRTVMVLGHQEVTQEVIVDRMRVLEGKNYLHSEVPIGEIRAFIESCRQQSPWLWLILDPYQLKELAQDYKNHIPVEEFEARGGKSNYEMAECLRTQIVNGRLLWYPSAGTIYNPTLERDETITDELSNLILKPMSYGYRFDHKANNHDDRACALGMLCVAAFNLPKPASWVMQRYTQIQKNPPADVYKRPHGGSGRELWGVKV